MRFFLAVAAALTSSSAIAQTIPCVPRDAVLEQLARYGEAPIGAGLVDRPPPVVLELLTSADGASWTLLATMPGGTSCVIATGRQWKSLPPPVPKAPEKEI